MKIFDGHADIWYDVAQKRKNGEENIVKNIILIDLKLEMLWVVSL